MPLWLDIHAQHCELHKVADKQMNTDFLDAHYRHWEDAELLFNAKHWANADHLYGFSAECGLKQLMKKFGMPIDTTTGTPSKGQDRVHVMENKKNSAWDRYESYRCGRGEGTHYALPSTNPFGDWDVFQRYAHRGHFDQVRVEPHRIGANDVHALVHKAESEGVFI